MKLTKITKEAGLNFLYAIPVYAVFFLIAVVMEQFAWTGGQLEAAVATCLTCGVSPWLSALTIVIGLQIVGYVTRLVGVMSAVVVYGTLMTVLTLTGEYYWWAFAVITVAIAAAMTWHSRRTRDAS